MNELISSFQYVVAAACFAVLAVIGIIALGRITGKSLAQYWSGMRGFVGILMLIGVVYYGGSKNITNKTSTDENIDLYSIDLSVSNIVEVVEGETNTTFHSRTFTIAVSEESAVPQPIWFRENQYQTWTNVTQVATFETEQPVLDAEKSGNGTNVYVWTSFDWTNSFNHAQWYIGTELPAVHVDVDDTDIIVLDEFNITSRKVRIKFHLNPEFTYPEGTVIEIQRKVGNKRYETIDEIEATPNGVYEWFGFEVGNNTSWRLHIAVTTD